MTTRLPEAWAEAEARAEIVVPLMRTDEAYDETDGMTAVALSIDDPAGRALLIQIGTSERGVFVTVNGYVDFEPVALSQFELDGQVMLTVDT